MEVSIINNKNVNTTIVKVHKKRGRKPKGGKIIKKINDLKVTHIEPNIILHLKCKDTDLHSLNNNFLNKLNYRFIGENKPRQL